MGTPILQEFVQRAEQAGLTLHSVSAQQGGKLLGEHYWLPDRPHVMHSLSKSFLSTAVGIAVREGLLAITDKVVDFFPDQLPEEVSPYLAAMTIRDLLVMAPGHEPVMMSSQRGLIEDPDWVRYYLSFPPQEQPGTRFVYDTGCTYVVSAILQKVAGQTARDYLMPRLFLPLGIENPVWSTCPMGITLGGAGLYLTNHQILRFGQLYLQKGCWGDRQLVPQEWVEAATRKQIDNTGNRDHPDWQAGYGYQFWINADGSYRADGMLCQLCVVLPALDAVLAVTAREENTPAVVDLLWETVKPKLC